MNAYHTAVKLATIRSAVGEAVRMIRTLLASQAQAWINRIYHPSYDNGSSKPLEARRPALYQLFSARNTQWPLWLFHCWPRDYTLHAYIWCHGHETCESSICYSKSVLTSLISRLVPNVMMGADHVMGTADTGFRTCYLEYNTCRSWVHFKRTSESWSYF